MVALVVLTGIKLALPDVIGHPTPFVLYFGAVVLAAWRGGIAAGVATTVLAAALGYVGFIVGRDVPTGIAATQVAVFGAEALSIAWLTGWSASERARAQAASAVARDRWQQIDAVFSALDHGVTVQGLDGRLVYANAAAARMIGFATPAEAVGADPMKVLQRFEMRDEHGDPLEADALPSRRIRRGLPPGELLVQFRSRGGEQVRWTLIEASAIRDEHGQLERVVDVFKDVTERRRQQEALEVSREWFSTALRSIGDAVIATDARGRITFVNPVAEQLTGWSSDGCEGLPLAEVFRVLDEETREAAESPVERVLREGTVAALKDHTVLVRKDASEIAIDDCAAPIRSPDGELVGAVLVFRDVSMSRRAMHRREFLSRASVELASSLDYNTTLATVARLAVPTIADWCAVDIVEDGRLLRLAVAHVDPARVELVEDIQRRYPPDPNDTTGVPHVLRTGEPEMVSVLTPAMIEAAAYDEEHLRLVLQLQLHSYLAVPMSHGGSTFGVITMAMAESRRTYGADDLELAQALAERAASAVQNARLYRIAHAARRDAELANRAKDEFLAMLGHELRNPLTPIIAALDLMKMRGVTGAEREREIVERQARSLVRLVDDLLDVSRITRGRIELDRVPVDLADAVAKGVEQASPLVESRRHVLLVDVARDMLVEGDAMRLAQVVANLVTNAAKYTPPGGRITVRGRREGDEVVLVVEDTGIGIAAETLPNIFEVFVQAPQAIDRAQGGLGLGLTIVRRLVELHGGTVAAHSAGQGKGSQFVVRLPASHVCGAAVAPIEPSTTRKTVDGLSILVVDDNADVLEMMVRSLEMLGHHPHAAADGPAALDLAPKVHPKLALIDLGLPGIDGYELARRLRDVPGLGRLRLVAVTGYGQLSDRERTKAAGFDAHLVKPVGIDAVADLIANLRPTG